jgi:predicted MFS family arabinose efflux permease
MAATNTIRMSISPAIATLMFMNAAFAINQTNIASLYLQISTDFGQTILGLGVLTSSFFLGYGVTGLPGGILAARFGPKNLVIIGGLLNALPVLASALSPTFFVFTLLRFFAGVGFALAFPPILVLVVRSNRDGSTGFSTALTAISFLLGAVAGIFGWSILGVIVGWRLSVLIGGVLSLVPSVGAMRILPDHIHAPEFRVRLAQIRQVLLNRPIILLAVMLFGIGAATALTNNFIVFYLEEHFQLDPEFAGLVGGMQYIPPIFSSLLFGRFYDKGWNAKLLIFASAAAVTLGVSLTGLDSVSAAILSVVIVGFSMGAVFTVGLSAARDLSTDKEYESLRVGFVDSVSLAGTFLSPIYFSLLVIDYSYSLAWLVGGVVAVLFAIPILFLGHSGARRPPRASS